MACECTTDSEGIAGSAAPFTAENAVTRHAPLWPPLKVVNMQLWKRGTGRGSSPLIERKASMRVAMRSLSRACGGGLGWGFSPRLLTVQALTEPTQPDRLFCARIT